MATTSIQSIGEFALAFEDEKVIILFGTNIPKELKDVSVIHNGIDDDSFTFKVGQTFSIEDQTYQLRAVGSLATKNFHELGHISIYFKELGDGILPGAIFVTPHIYPKMKVGSVITFSD